ncbi:MAG: TolC family protein, partial [Acidobacteriota bacterium]|nr:TolC family protein [Acidobacteriota bacterium]
MRSSLRLALALIPLAIHAQVQAPSVSSAPPAEAAEDPILQALLAEALEKNPDLSRAKALVEAEKERIPQAGALPDPSLSLGIQNDSFKSIQIGKMETSWYTVMVTQPLPWPGKRKLREEVAGLGADITNVAVERARLSLEADVSRAYYGLLLVRGRQQLLEDHALFLRNALAITQTRYEVGQGSQADILRAQAELSRHDQSHFALRSEERGLVATLNRLRGTAEDTAIPTTASLDQLSFPVAPIDSALAQAEAQSPELRAARLGVKQAEAGLDLVKRDRYPDFAVSGGVMPRGALEPMWTLGFSIALPLWSKQKQQRAVAEQDWRRKSQGSETASVRNLLNQRTRERRAQLESALGT